MRRHGLRNRVKRTESNSGFPRFASILVKFLPPTLPKSWPRAGIGVRDGHMYSPRLMQRLELSQESGAVRVSLVHYNTIEEIHRFASVLRDLSKNG